MLTHKELQSCALARTDVKAEYDRLDEEFARFDELQKARSSAGITQAEAGIRIDTTQCNTKGDMMMSLPQKPFSWLDSICFSTLRLNFISKTHAGLHHFPGHEIRGGIGRHFKTYMNCSADHDLDCNHCPDAMRKDCLYDRLFSHRGQRIKPFVLRLCPVLQKGRPVVRKGESIWVDILLVGNAVRFIGPAVDSLNRKVLKLENGRCHFELKSAGYVHEDGQVSAFEFDRAPALGKLGASHGNSIISKDLRGSLEMSFHTPCELTNSHGNFVRNPEEMTLKRILIRTLQRSRTMALEYCGWTQQNGGGGGNRLRAGDH